MHGQQNIKNGWATIVVVGRLRVKPVTGQLCFYLIIVLKKQEINFVFVYFSYILAEFSFRLRACSTNRLGNIVSDLRLHRLCPVQTSAETSSNLADILMVIFRPIKQTAEQHLKIQVSHILHLTASYVMTVNIYTTPLNKQYTDNKPVFVLRVMLNK
jgi:hypothetical protein